MTLGEIGMCGGAVMCLVFQSRKATRDVIPPKTKFLVEEILS